MALKNTTLVNDGGNGSVPKSTTTTYTRSPGGTPQQNTNAQAVKKVQTKVTVQPTVKPAVNAGGTPMQPNVQTKPDVQSQLMGQRYIRDMAADQQVGQSIVNPLVQGLQNVNNSIQQNYQMPIQQKEQKVKNFLDYTGQSAAGQLLGSAAGTATSLNMLTNPIAAAPTNKELLDAGLTQEQIDRGMANQGEGGLPEFLSNASKNMMDRAAENEEGMTNAEKYLSRGISGAIGQAPQMIANAVVPFGGDIWIGLSSFGNAWKDAKEHELNNVDALRYATANALVEVASNRWFQGSRFDSKGVFDYVKKNLLSKVTGTAPTLAAKVFADILGEQIEEESATIIEYLLNYDMLQENRDADGNFDVQKLLGEVRDTWFDTLASTVVLNAVTGGYSTGQARRVLAEAKSEELGQALLESAETFVEMSPEEQSVAIEAAAKMSGEDPSVVQQRVYEAAHNLYEQQMSDSSVETAVANNLQDKEPVAEYQGQQIMRSAADSSYEAMPVKVLGSQLGRNIVIVDKLPNNADGVWMDDKILIPERIIAEGKGTWTVVKHELTHSLKGANVFNDLLDYANEQLALRPDSIVDTEPSGEEIRYESYKDYMDRLVSRYASYGAYGLTANDTWETVQNNPQLAALMREEAAAFWVQNNLFQDEAAINQLVRSSRSTAQRIWQSLRDMVRKLVGIDDETTAALRRAERMFAQALAETAPADEAEQYFDEQLNRDTATVGEEVDAFERNPMFSLKSLTHDIADGQMKRALVSSGVFTASEAAQFMERLNQLMKLIEPKRAFLDLNEEDTRESRVFHPFKQNSDKLYKISLDFSTLCKKRIVTQAIIERLNMARGFALDAQTQFAIEQLLREYQKQNDTFQVACALCYVESARLKSPKVINQFMNNAQAEMIAYFAKETGTDNKAYMDAANAELRMAAGLDGNASKDSLKEAIAKMTQDQFVNTFSYMGDKLDGLYDPAWFNKKTGLMSKSAAGKFIQAFIDETRQETADILTDEQREMVDKVEELVRDHKELFLTADGLTELKRTEPAIYRAFTDKVRSATRSKALETNVAYYWGDSDGWATDALVKKMNQENGLRTQSWSDMQLEHLLDNIVAICELATKKAKMHGYTKVPEFVEVLGRTGLMINMSLIPEGRTGLDRNGNLIFSSTEGMPIETAMELRDKYANTAGTICIGINDRQILELMKSPMIDYIIPYHISGLTQHMRSIANIGGWKSYEKHQNERLMSDGKTAAKNGPDFSEWFTPVYEANQGASALDVMRMAQDHYLELCAERDLIPKFEMFLERGQDGSWHVPVGDDGLPINYWKLLIDRKMITDLTGDGSIIEQQAVRPDFVWEDEVGADGKVIRGLYSIVDQAEDPRTQEVVDELTNYVEDAMQSGVVAKIAKNDPQVKKAIEVFNMAHTPEAQEGEWSGDVIDDTEQPMPTMPPKQAAMFSLPSSKVTQEDIDAYRDRLYIDYDNEYSSSPDYEIDDDDLAASAETLAQGRKLLGKELFDLALREASYYDNANYTSDMTDQEIINLSGGSWHGLPIGLESALEELENRQSGTPVFDDLDDPFEPISFAVPRKDSPMDYGGQYESTVNWDDVPLKDHIADYESRLEYDAYDYSTEFEPTIEDVKWAADTIEEGKELLGDRLWEKAISYANRYTNPKGILNSSMSSMELADYPHQMFTGIGIALEELKKQISDGDDLQRKIDNGARLSLPSNDDARFSLKGKNANGIEVYETGADPARSYSERIKDAEELIEKQYQGVVVKFVDANQDAQYAYFNNTKKGRGELVRKTNDSDANGWKAKVNLIAAGDLLDLSENMLYDSSKPNKGNKHHSTNNWDYYVKTVQVDGRVYDVVANIDNRKNGDQYFYSIGLKENKKISPNSSVTPMVSVGGALSGLQSKNTTPYPVVNPPIKAGSSGGMFSLPSMNKELADRDDTAFNPSEPHLQLDDETREWLNSQPTETVYRAMQLIDGELYPPMAARVADTVGGKRSLVKPSVIGEWERSNERPDLIRNGNKFTLDKANGTSIDAAYNPYFHTSRSPLNDQFSSAYKRPNLVVVEGSVPSSELTSGYQAEHAKDPVGEMKWHSGPVSSKLTGDKARRVILSRWFRPDRILSDSEVAQNVQQLLEGENISIPSNVVTPGLKTELENLGVPITESNAMFSLPSADQDYQNEIDAVPSDRDFLDIIPDDDTDLLAEQLSSKGSSPYAIPVKQINTISRNIKKSWKTRMSPEQISDYLTNLYKGFDQSEYSEDDMRQLAEFAARDIADMIPQRKGISTESQMVLNALKETTIQLNEAQREEARATFGNLREFQKQIAPIKLRKDGTMLADAWNDWVEDSATNGILNPETYDDAMPAALAEVVQKLKNSTEESDYDYDLTVDGIVDDIMHGYMESPQEPIEIPDNEFVQASVDELMGDGDGVVPMTDIDATGYAQRINGNSRRINGWDTFTRVLDTAAGGDKEVRRWFESIIDRPLYEQKRQYNENINRAHDALEEIVKKTGIRAGTKESAAVQWYGENLRTNADGSTEKYGLTKLKNEFPNKWQDIVEMEQWCRRQYLSYVDRLNAMLEQIYPDIKERAMQRVATAKMNVESLTAQVENTQKHLDRGEYSAEFSTDSLRFLTEELAKAQKELAEAQKNLDTGNYAVGKRVMPRKNYFHHFLDPQANGLGKLSDMFKATEVLIDSSLVGVSDTTKPKSRWASFLQRRGNGEYTADAVGGMARYMPAAEYKIAIDPFISHMRGVVTELQRATSEKKNANNLIGYLSDWTNALAGKTTGIDRSVMEIFDKVNGRGNLELLRKVNGRFKGHAVGGNIASAIKQISNIPTAMGQIKSNTAWAKGFGDYLKDKFTGDSGALDQSVFMTERYFDWDNDEFKPSSAGQKIKDFSNWMMGVGDHEAAKWIWYAAYEEALEKGVDDPIFYADRATKDSVGGRGIGEVPVNLQSKVVNLLAPFQLEVTNTWNDLVKMVGERDARGVLRFMVGSWAMESMMEEVFGLDVLPDVIGTVIDTVQKSLKSRNNPEDDDEEKENIIGSAIREALGQIVSMIPGNSLIAQLVFGINSDTGEKLFGEGNPSRYELGLGGVKDLTQFGSDLAQVATGNKELRDVDIFTPLVEALLPFGGRQLTRSYKAAQDLGWMPYDTWGNLPFAGGERHEIPGAYTSKGDLKFELPDGVENVHDLTEIMKALLFGEYATEAGKEYLESGKKAMSSSKVAKAEAYADAGGSIEDYKNFLSQADADGNGQTNLSEIREYLHNSGLSDDDQVNLWKQNVSAERAEKADAFAEKGYDPKDYYLFDINADADGSGNISMKEARQYFEESKLPDGEQTAIWETIISDAKKEKLDKYTAEGYDPEDFLMFDIHADADGNGSVSQAETTSYLDSTDLDKDQKSLIFMLMFPKSEKKNPYR